MTPKHIFSGISSFAIFLSMAACSPDTPQAGNNPGGQVYGKTVTISPDSRRPPPYSTVTATMGKFSV
ncbi:MAG: hypothetical protein K2G80_07370, partial [Bacteroidales bacterium]|nr:hypothetical protein [Bacteroidales bacterium]